MTEIVIIFIIIISSIKGKEHCMFEYIDFLLKYLFGVLFLIFAIIGISCYFNIFTNIINFKVNNVKKKYVILNEKEYLRIEGIYNIMLSILSLIDFLTISFKENWIFPVLLTTTVIVNISVYFLKKFEKEFLENKE